MRQALITPALKHTAIHIALLIVVTVITVLSREYWMNTMAEFMVAAVLIALAGIPHGSLDHKIAMHSNKGLRLPRFLLQYIASALLFLLVWLLAPGIALLLFLLLTAWHFGETDFVIFGCRHRPGWLILLYGASLTLWLLGHDPAALAQWLEIITPQSPVSNVIAQFLTYLPARLWFALLSIILLLNGAPGSKQVMARLAFLVFLFLLTYTSLLTGFILYFAGWHSLHALTHIRRKVFRKADIVSMVRQALPTTAAALAFLFLVGWLSDGQWLQHNGLPALFILLSMLTLPHMTEMHRLYNRKS
jgi:Brp/Blh family beta-carotene 15,15'-monooxygenase